jgi:hypothetical protein
MTNPKINISGVITRAYRYYYKKEGSFAIFTVAKLPAFLCFARPWGG